MSDTNIATPVRENHRSMSASVVWLAPLLALGVSLGIAWKTYADRGPLIEITLDSASGLEANKTVIKHKDVEIGKVETIGFTDTLEQVLVSARVDKNLAPYFDDSAQFWVVKPEISARGISGLETVLSGAYIEVAWDGTKGAKKRSYAALKDAPLSKPSDKGMRLRLRANDGGSMTSGAPILYKRIEVGRIESKELSADGERVDFTIFIDAPYDRLITSATRFWDMSGVAVEIGAEGAKLQVDSLASLLQGGISFDTVATDGTPIVQLQSFVLYEGETEARRSIFRDDPNSQLRLSVAFDSSVRGLKIGAPVEYRGLRIGEVTDVAAKIRRTVDDVNDITLIVTIVISPARLGLEEDSGTTSIDFMKNAVARGLRAKLGSASLLTGALFVELVEQPDAPIALFDELEEPYPRLPSVPSDFEDFTASAEGVLNRINALPIEELMFSANDLLRNLNALAAADSTAAMPQQVLGLITDARALVAEPNLQQAPKDLAATLAAARALMEQIETGGTAEALVSAIQNTSDAAKAISTAAIAVPALVTSATALSTNFAELPLNDLIVTASTLLKDIDKIVTAEEIQQIPVDLGESIAALREIMTSLSETEATKTLSEALVASREAAKAVSAASANVPSMVASMSGVAGTLNDLPFEALVQAATQLVKDADTLIANDGMQAAPQALADALDAARALLVDLKDAGAAKNLSEALQAARDAATSISVAAASTPQLIDRFEKIAANVQQLPLNDLVMATQSLITDVNKVVASDGVQAAPQALADTLNAARALMVDLQRAETAQKLSDALVEARYAASSFSNAAAGVPDLTRRLGQLADKATALPIEGLLASTTLLVQDADRILTAPGATEIPGSLTAAIDQVRSLVVELRRSGTATNVNGALVSVAQAGQSFQQLSQNLSVLIPRLVAVADSADSVLSSIDVGSELNYEAATALREVRDAARAITALAATVDRRPNSLLFGK